MFNFASAALQMFWGFAYWYMIGYGFVSWLTVSVYSVSALVTCALAIKMLQLRRWARTVVLWLAGFSLVTSPLTLTTSQTRHAGPLITILAGLVIQLGILVSLTRPSARRAFAKRSPVPGGA
jgi:hypothetical protein